MNYTHIVIDEDYKLELIPYDENKLLDDKVEKAVSINNILNITVDSIDSQGLSREGTAKSIIIQLWDHAKTSLYIKSDWNKINDIVFSSYRTDEDKTFLATILPIYCALSNKTNKQIQDNWEELFKSIRY